MWWGVNLKTPSSSMWVIKMSLYYRDSFIFVMGNPYSCTVGLDIETGHKLKYTVVGRPAYLNNAKASYSYQKPLGSSAAMMFLFLVVTNIWQWVSFKLSFEIMLKKYSNLYLTSYFWICRIRIKRLLWNLMCRGNVKWYASIKIQHFSLYWFVDPHFFSIA